MRSRCFALIAHTENDPDPRVRPFVLAIEDTATVLDIVTSANTPSCRVLEKSGFVRIRAESGPISVFRYGPAARGG